MQIQFHGHACASIITDTGLHLLIDPFITGNSQAKIEAESLYADVIFLTHGHWDHLGDVVSIAQRTGAQIICNPEIVTYLSGKGLSNFHSMNIGGRYVFEWGSVKMTPALHSSSIEENGLNIYLGNPAGFLITLEGKTIYHAGDTGLSLEMRLLGSENKIDLALLPIGGNFTMDPKDAIYAARALNTRRVIPIHYNTFPMIVQDVNLFSNQLLNLGISCFVLQPEESMSL